MTNFIFESVIIFCYFFGFYQIISVATLVTIYVRRLPSRCLSLFLASRSGKLPIFAKRREKEESIFITIPILTNYCNPGSDNAIFAHSFTVCINPDGIQMST